MHPSSDPSRQPVIVGVGQLRGERDGRPQHAREPLELVLVAARQAAADAVGAVGADSLLRSLDSVLAVRCVSWAYESLAAMVATRCAARARHVVDSPVGGQWPLRLLDEAAARVAAGQSQGALLVGVEAQAALRALARAGLDPVQDAGWSGEPGGVPPLDAGGLVSDRMLAAGLFLPTRAYALADSRLSAELGQTPAQSLDWSARIYEGLADEAAANPAAWSPQRRSAHDIATVTSANRMVCEPYPLAVNAMPYVDQAAAVLLLSAEAALEAGVDPARMVHVQAAAAVQEDADLLARRELGRCPALDQVLLSVSDAGAGAPEVVDVYSCFPVVTKLAELALGRSDVLSATGGHAAFGGPLNSYSVHALVAVVERLRAGTGTGIVHANGGFLTAQSAVLLGRTPQPGGYRPAGAPSPAASSGPLWVEPADAVGEQLVVEALTVEHERHGRPAQAFVVARDQAGRRTAAASAPGDTAAASGWSIDALKAGAASHVGRRVRLVGTPEGAVVMPPAP